MVAPAETPSEQLYLDQKNIRFCYIDPRGGKFGADHKTAGTRALTVGMGTAPHGTALVITIK
jgi:hypothetical protein